MHEINILSKTFKSIKDKSEQECTHWNVSPSLLIIDIMLIVLNIKLYYNYHINLTKKTKHWPLNHENEVKVRWTMPDRHVQLTILPYNRYSWSISYRLRKTDQNTKTLHWAMNRENEVKVKWNLGDWQIDHKIFPYTKYSWPIAISIRKKYQNSKTQLWPLNHENDVKVRWHLPVGHVHLSPSIHRIY